MSGADTISLEDAARYLRLAPSTLRKRAAAGRVPGIKQGGRWRFSPRELKAYLDQFRNDAPPTSEAVLKELGYLKHVYVIRCGDLVKIGVAADVKERWRSLSTANPAIEPVIYQTPAIANAREIEKYAHRALYSHRFKGEWFRCDASVAVDVVRSLELTESRGQ